MRVMRGRMSQTALAINMSMDAMTSVLSGWAWPATSSATVSATGCAWACDPGTGGMCTCAAGGSAKTKWGPPWGWPGSAHAPQQIKGRTVPRNTAYAAATIVRQRGAQRPCRTYLGCTGTNPVRIIGLVYHGDWGAQSGGILARTHVRAKSDFWEKSDFSGSYAWRPGCINRRSRASCDTVALSSAQS